MPTKENILIIASKSTYHTAPRGIQANMIVNELSKYHRVYLITSNYSLPDKESYFSSLVKVFTINNINKYLSKIFTRILLDFGFRDFIWSHRVKNKAVKICRSENINKIISFSFPASNADVGYYIKKTIPTINLISYFSDPISLNPYLVSHAFDKWRLQRYENKLFTASDTIVFPSTVMKNIYSTLYPVFKNKIRIIPHCFKPVKESPKILISSKKEFHIIRYFGLLNRTRHPFSILKFVTEHSGYFKQQKIKFEFIGNLSVALKLKLYTIKYDNKIISFIGEIDYQKVPSLMKDSFMLLLIDANFIVSPFFPSKLVEYLSYKIPIIGVTPMGSESENILKKAGHLAIPQERLEKILPYLSKMLKSNHLKLQNIENYNVENVTKLWDDLINE